jgi:NAD(P)-dependent dehydrogenase (short-subunit alcohol dehydrogenase family)
VLNFRLDGKKALVTGAARGLGEAIADGLGVVFPESGATVYGTSRDADSARSISERYGTPALPIDITETGEIRRFARTLMEVSGGIDLLVNNAGVNVPKPALELTAEDWDTIFDTNLKGSFFLTTAIAQHWMHRGTPGAIVNVASQAGIVGIEERAAYGTSKAGLIHLTKILALEWAPAGIRVNAVAPTFVRTELTASTLGRPEWAAELLSRIPIGRFGEPDDIAGAIAFLLSDAASMITGHTLAIDGGYTIH